MSTLQTALRSVGYKTPRIKARPTLANVVDEVIKPITRSPRIQVQRAGGFYTARWYGARDRVFADSQTTLFGGCAQERLDD